MPFRLEHTTMTEFDNLTKKTKKEYKMCMSLQNLIYKAGARWD